MAFMIGRISVALLPFQYTFSSGAKNFPPCRLFRTREYLDNWFAGGWLQIKFDQQFQIFVGKKIKLDVELWGKGPDNYELAS